MFYALKIINLNSYLEEKTLTFSIQTTASNKVATAQTAPAVANGVSQDGLANGTGTSEVVVPEAQANSATTTETKIYLRLNKELSEVYLISPEDDNINTKIEADVIVNIKEGKVYKDKDEKEWYLLEPIGLKKTGVAIQYKGLISEDELGEKFSAYNWSKFGFEVKEDASNTYIYDFEKKQPFFEEICNIVDIDGDGILEPYELQRALNNHYIANKLSHLVCKHHNEWAYSGQYLSPLIEELDQFYEKALKKDADGKELENQQELDAIREERKEAFKAKVEQLALWEGIEARKSSYRSKWVNGALVTSPITMGPYLTYKFGKWVYEKMTSEDESEQEIPLSPFPIANPVVYHFHPVAFVEQMRRMNVISAEEAKVRAYMRMLRVGEGTGEIIKSFDKKTSKVIYVTNDFEKGYTTAFGGNKISDLSDHPRKNYGGSSAAGAYQVMTYTWDDTNLSLKREKHKLNSFSKESQDKFCVVLMKYHPGCSEFIDLIIKGDIENATRKCGSRIWASLPCKGDNSRYKFKGNPQPATPMKDVLEHFEKFYNDELKGKTNLHLKYGFLDEFGYDY